MNKTPLLDVVMLVHDTWEWADLAIRAVENHTKNPFNLILVDMASVEAKTKAGIVEAEARGHTIVRLAENKSFSGGVNAGIRAGTAPNVCVLNDDAIVTDGWDSHFLADLSDKAVGMVGARVIGSALGAMGDGTFVGEPPFLVFVCVALRREVWNQLGPMDEATFDGFSSEDLDYSWWVKKHGYKLKLSNAIVLHAGSRTLAKKGVDVSAETRARYEQKYNTRLMQKWEKIGGPDWVNEHSRHKLKVLVAAYSPQEFLRGDFATAIITMKASTYPFTYINQRRTAIQEARALVANYATDNGFDVVVQLDDDATFPHDLLSLLLRHEKEVVSALAYQRGAPYNTVAYDLSPDSFDKDGNVMIQDRAGLMMHHLDSIEGQGLRRVDITGFHVSAIHTNVFRKLRKAGIKNYYGGYENKIGEDYAFPVAPETPVLGADFRWRSITEYKPGDTVIGFDEHSPKNSSRRFGAAVVQGLIRKTLPRVRIVTDDREIITTAEHPWLMVNSQAMVGSQKWTWTPAGELKVGRVLAAVMPVAINPNIESEDYCRGYVQGLFQSDGTRSNSERETSSGNRIRYVQYSVRMKDVAPLERVASALARLGIESGRAPMYWDGDPFHAPMHTVHVGRKAAAAKLDVHFRQEEISSPEFAAGYLAGMYDGDGSCNGGSVYVHNTKAWKKERLWAAAKMLGVPFDRNEPKHVRMSGADAIFRFWQATSPSLTRRLKLTGQPGNDGVTRGKEVKHRPEVVRAVERLPASEVFCLTTSTSTFIAAGLASHNCVNLRKIGVSPYIDTDLIVGHIGDAKIVDATYKQLFKAGRAP